MSEQLFDVYYDARAHLREVFDARSRSGGLRAGTWTFDLMRLADHILSRHDVRPDRAPACCPAASPC